MQVKQNRADPQLLCKVINKLKILKNIDFFHQKFVQQHNSYSKLFYQLRKQKRLF